jgi:hypothetical protein
MKHFQIFFEKIGKQKTDNLDIVIEKNAPIIKKKRHKQF